MAKFNEQIIQKCVDWVCENGLIDYGGTKLIDFCNVMGIGKSTYYRWMENETFGTAIKKAKEDFKNGLERNVVSSLARSAIGYEYEQVSSEYYMEGKKKKLKKEVRKNVRVEPNVGAGIFLLTNLAPDRWKNNQKAEALAKSELEQMGIDSRYVGNPTGIYGRPAFSKGSKLEKKA